MDGTGTGTGVETVTVPGPLDHCGPHVLFGEPGYNPLEDANYRLCKLEDAAIGGVSWALRAFIDELWAELKSFFATGTVLGDAIDALHAGIDRAWQWLHDEGAAAAAAFGKWLFPVTVIGLAFLFSPELRRALEGMKA